MSITDPPVGPFSTTSPNTCLRVRELQMGALDELHTARAMLFVACLESKGNRTTDLDVSKNAHAYDKYVLAAATSNSNMKQIQLSSID